MALFVHSVRNTLSAWTSDLLLSNVKAPLVCKWQLNELVLTVQAGAVENGTDGAHKQAPSFLGTNSNGSWNKCLLDKMISFKMYLLEIYNWLLFIVYLVLIFTLNKQIIRLTLTLKYIYIYKSLKKEKDFARKRSKNLSKQLQQI